MIKAVLIDIDNTLLDFDAYVQTAMKEGFALFGLGDYTEHAFTVFDHINNELWQQIENGTLTRDELLAQRWNRVFAALGIEFDGPRFERYFGDRLFSSAIPIEGAQELLEYLSRKYILCAASNGPYDQQVNRLKTGKMLRYFADLFISEKVGCSKPSPRFFEHCLNALNTERKRRGETTLRPDEIIMIGDSLSSDMAGAVASGMISCYFDPSASGITNGLPIDYTVHSLAEIKDIL